MNPEEIMTKFNGRKPTIIDYDLLRKHAILLPLIEKDNETHILFEVRSMKLRTQPGDICFPGGKIDQTDPDPQFSAIRETTEELGIRKTAIQDVHPLDYIASDNGRMIYPYTGIITDPGQMKPNPAEVSETFTVPLSYLQTTDPETYNVHYSVEPEADFPFDLIVGGEQYKWRVPSKKELFYHYNGKVIWGLTAKILHHFLTLLNS